MLFKGNYGSSLGSFSNAANLLVRSAEQDAQRSRDIGNVLGQQIGGLIQQYGLNKEKRNELTNKIENRIRLDPSIAERITMTGEEEYDKKNVTNLEKLSKGELGLKGLQSLDSAMATIKEMDLLKQSEQQTALNNQLMQERILTSKQAREATESLRQIQKEGAERNKSAYNAYEKQLEALQERILEGEKYEDLSVQDRFILGNATGIKNRTIDLKELVYDPTKELDFETAKVEFENIKSQSEISALEVKEKKKESEITPEFTDRDSAIASTKDLPGGVSASIKKFKDGFNIEYSYKAKELTDIPSIEGYPNYKAFGGAIYEANPEKQTLTKVSAEEFGKESELLIKVIEKLTTVDVEDYSIAKIRGTQNEDFDYELEDQKTGKIITVPYNQDLENKLDYLDKLRKQLERQVDLDLTTKIRL